MGEIIDQKLGSAGDLSLAFEGGNLVLKIQVGAKLLNGGVDAGLAAQAAVTPAVFIKLLEDAIPGNVDNAILDALAAAFIPKA